MAGCTAYRPQAVDPAHDTAEWQQLSAKLCPAGTALDRKALHSLGLLLNPDLNKARLKYAAGTEAARYAGLWEDPTLSLEGVRVLRENFNNNSISPSLSIPVTGQPALARKIAEQYNEADYWDMRAQEREFLAKLDTLRYGIMITHAKQKILRERLQTVREEKRRIDSLYRMGEAELSDYQASCQRYNDTMKEAQEMDNAHLEKHRELLSMLGLHPSVAEMELSGTLPQGVPGAVAVPTEDELLNAPALLSALAAYGATETELRSEIRKQYPTLSIGPSLTREEGLNKVGLGVEVGLPLWNRNRGGVAEATGNRAMKYHDTIALWRKMLQDVAALSERQKLATTHCRTEYERLNELSATGEQQERLYNAGETSLPALADARHEIFQRRLSYLDCLAALLDIQVQLQYNNPTFQP